MSLSSLRRTAQSLAWSNSRYSSFVNAAIMRQCTETPSLLTPIASVRNVFTVGVKRSVVPALFPEIEMRCQKLYDQDVGKASGLNVLYDVTYVFYSSWPAHPTLFKFMPYSTMVSMRPSSRVDKFLVLWCVQQVRFLVPVKRGLVALVRANWNLEFLL